MGIEAERKDGVALVTVHGPIRSAHTMHSITRIVGNLLVVVVDLQAVDRVPARDIHYLMKLTRGGAKLNFIGPSAHVRHMLTRTGLAEVIHIHASLEEALSKPIFSR